MVQDSAPTGVRHQLVLIATLMAVLLYLDRYCISFAEIFIQEDLGLTDMQVSWMLSAFFWSYALAQVPSGWLTDRFGARLMLTLYVLLWSLFTALTGLATGFAILLVMRLGFGLGQAGAYPTSANVISKWVPFSQRGIASSIVSLGGRFGGALAPVATAYLLVLLVPVSHSSALKTADMLDLPQFARRVLGEEPSATDGQQPAEDVLAADVGQRLVARLDTDTRGWLVRAAARQPTADHGTAAVAAPDDQDPQMAGLIAELNHLLVEPDLFREEDVRQLSLSRQARRRHHRKTNPVPRRQSPQRPPSRCAKVS